MEATDVSASPPSPTSPEFFVDFDGTITSSAPAGGDDIRSYDGEAMINWILGGEDRYLLLIEKFGVMKRDMNTALYILTRNSVSNVELILERADKYISQKNPGKELLPLFSKPIYDRAYLAANYGVGSGMKWRFLKDRCIEKPKVPCGFVDNARNELPVIGYDEMPLEYYDYRDYMFQNGDAGLTERNLNEILQQFKKHIENVSRGIRETRHVPDDNVAPLFEPAQYSPSIFYSSVTERGPSQTQPSEQFPDDEPFEFAREGVDVFIDLEGTITVGNLIGTMSGKDVKPIDYLFGGIERYKELARGLNNLKNGEPTCNLFVMSRGMTEKEIGKIFKDAFEDYLEREGKNRGYLEPRYHKYDLRQLFCRIVGKGRMEEYTKSFNFKDFANLIFGKEKNEGYISKIYALDKNAAELFRKEKKKMLYLIKYAEKKRPYMFVDDEFDRVIPPLFRDSFPGYFKLFTRFSNPENKLGFLNKEDFARLHTTAINLKDDGARGQKRVAENESESSSAAKSAMLEPSHFHFMQE